MSGYPNRIVCLTEETTETLYLLGQGDRVVGVSGYTVRPPEARAKPKVSAFINARFDKIEALRPDLVLAFSDLQADLTAELVRRGLTGRHVQSAQHRRDPADDSNAWRVGRVSGGCETLATDLAADLDRIRQSARAIPGRLACSSRNGTSRSFPASDGSRSSSRLPAATPIFPEFASAGSAAIASSDRRKLPGAIPK